MTWSRLVSCADAVVAGGPHGVDGQGAPGRGDEEEGRDRSVAAVSGARCTARLGTGHARLGCCTDRQRCVWPGRAVS